MKDVPGADLPDGPGGYDEHIAEKDAGQWKAIAEANVKWQQEATARANLLAERLVWIAEALGARVVEVPLTGPEVLDLAQQTYERAVALSAEVGHDRRR